jgi:hypothetical protein
MNHKIEYHESVGLKRARCSCGWESNTYVSRLGVSWEAEDHLEAEIEKLASSENPPMKMADSVNAVMKESYISSQPSLADQVRAELMSLCSQHRCGECNTRFFGHENADRQWADHMMSCHPSLIAAIISRQSNDKNG